MCRDKCVRTDGPLSIAFYLQMHYITADVVLYSSRFFLGESCTSGNANRFIKMENLAR